jgi:hypothetical protein
MSSANLLVCLTIKVLGLDQASSVVRFCVQKQQVSWNFVHIFLIGDLDDVADEYFLPLLSNPFLGSSVKDIDFFFVFFSVIFVHGPVFLGILDH